MEEYTGQQEILGGRVKRHPNPGILAKRDSIADMDELKRMNAYPIDAVVVNIYPFVKYCGDEKKSSLEMIELIDVGGPTMLRAAAKNFNGSLPICDFQDYEMVISASKEAGGFRNLGNDFRRTLSIKVFSLLAQDNHEVGLYLSRQTGDYDPDFPTSLNHKYDLYQSLRYGENPHQKAAFYKLHDNVARYWEQLHGRELSYNNILDLDAALSLIRLLIEKSLPWQLLNISNHGSCFVV